MCSSQGAEGGGFAREEEDEWESRAVVRRSHHSAVLLRHRKGCRRGSASREPCERGGSVTRSAIGDAAPRPPVSRHPDQHGEREEQAILPQV